MALDGVPWAIGVGQVDGEPGAELPADALRTATYTGTEGVFSSTDFRVSATGTPSGQLMVGAGAARIINRSPGGERQAYVARNTAFPQEFAEPAETTSSGGRSDLIVVRVEDPQFPPWQGYTDPEAIKHGPYDFVRVIPNVPSNTTSARDLTGQYATQSMLALYRIDIPESTGTFTDAMLVDLRKLDRPQRYDFYERLDLPYSPDTMGTPIWQTFPNLTTQVEVPEWPCEALIRMDISGVQTRNAPLAGTFRGLLGASTATKESYYNEQIAGDTRHNYVVGSRVVIPEPMLGTRVPLKCQARRAAGAGILQCNADTQVVFSVTFQELVS